MKQAVMLFQEEEQRGADPSYLAAAQQTNYRIPPKKLTMAVAATTLQSPAEPAFDLFFPTDASPAHSPAESWSASWGGGEQKPTWQEEKAEDSQRLNYLDSDTLWGESSPPLACPSDESQVMNPGENVSEAAKVTEAGATGASTDDLLELLGITTLASKEKAHIPQRPQTQSSELKTRTDASQENRQDPSTIEVMASENQSREEDSMAEAQPLDNCPLCKHQSSNYICLPCRHWGPCMSCVPNAKDKDHLYPVCMRCSETFKCLVRVYKR